MMAQGNDQALTNSSSPRVFVLPAFEIIKDYPFPKDKKELVKLFRQRKIFQVPGYAFV